MNELISIIIPTFNRASFICRAVESALEQTYTNVEVIVVDDGSTDHTSELLQSYRELRRFRYLRQGNKGRSIARNEGLRLANGEWILFLDSDDYLDREAIRKLVDLAKEAGNSSILFGNYAMLDKGLNIVEHHGTIYGKVLNQILVMDLLNNLYCLTKTGSFMIHKSLAVEIGGFSTRFEPAEDLDYTIKALMKGKVSHIPDLVLYVERHEGNSNEKEMQEAMIRTCKHYLKTARDWGMQLPATTRKQALAAFRWRIANASYEIDKHLQAFAYYTRLIRCKPAVLRESFILKQYVASLVPPVFKRIMKKNGKKKQSIV